MQRRLWWVGISALLLFAVTQGDNQAQARSWGSWGSGSSGSWGSYGSSGSWGRSHGSWGGFRRHHRWRGSYASHSSGSWGGYSHSSGSWGYSHSSGSWGSSSSGSYGGYYHSAPRYESHESYRQPSGGGEGEKEKQDGGPPTPSEDASHPAYSRTLTSVSFSVKVPNDATVYVNGKRTTSTGELRRYVSRGLTAGRSYTFNVRAEYEQNGEVVSRTKVLRLRPGQQEQLAFDFEESPEQVASEPVQTKLTLNVPEAAEVFLAGHQTESTGPVREFSTTKLAAGTTWDDYRIRVELEQDGKRMVEEKTIVLSAGDAKELTFAFGGEATAKVARLEK